MQAYNVQTPSIRTHTLTRDDKVSSHHRRRRRGAVRARAPPPPKIRGKYFSGNYVKFGHFAGKNRVKFDNFVNFSQKYYKNSDILLIFRARIT